MSDFKEGARVAVNDPGLAQLRAIMRNATGEEPPPNHHGTIEKFFDDDTALIVFDDEQGAPYPLADLQLLDNDSETEN